MNKSFVKNECHNLKTRDNTYFDLVITYSTNIDVILCGRIERVAFSNIYNLRWNIRGDNYCLGNLLPLFMDLQNSLNFAFHIYVRVVVLAVVVPPRQFEQTKMVNF